MALNQRQLLFVAEYMQHGNAAKSAIAAGYSPKTAVIQGSKLLTNPKVRYEVAKRKAQQLQASTITVATILKNAQDLYDYCSQKDQQGRVLNSTNAIKANEQMGRIVGAFIERIDATVTQVSLADTLQALQQPALAA